MPRKLVDHSNLLIFYIQDMLQKNWKIIPLQNISEKKLFETLSKSKIFLSFSLCDEDLSSQNEATGHQ